MGNRAVTAQDPPSAPGPGSVRQDLAGPLRPLVAGQCLGQGADGLAQIAFAQFALFDVGHGATPGRIAAVLAVTLLPFSLVGPIAGVLIDRFDRRRTLIAVSLLRALLVVGGAAVVQARSTAAAYVIVVLLLSTSRLVLTAKGAALPRTVPRDRLVPANALSAIAGMSAAFIGAVGGSQLVGHSAVAGFLVAGLLYATAAAAFTTVPPLGGEGGGRLGDPLLPRLRSTLTDLADGARVVARTPEIRRPMLSVTVHRLLLGAGFVVLILVADSEYRLRASGYGIALAVTGIASFAGSVAATPLAARFGARALVPAAFPPAAAAVYVGGLSPTLGVLIACVGMVSFAFAVLKVAADALIGGATPDAVRGRVFSIYDVLYNVAFALAGLAMVPWWHQGRERALLWWVAAAFAVGWAVVTAADRGVRLVPPLRRAPRAPRRGLWHRPRPSWARLRGRVSALPAGALLVLVFPAPSWWWLAWFALVPLLLVVRAAPTRREAMVRAWWGAAAFVMATQYWLTPNIGPAILLMGALLGALWLPWGWAVHRLLSAPVSGGRSAAALLVVPSAWSCAEAARSWQSLGGPWALLGTSQWRQPVLLASASLGGVWLTGFLLVTANTALVVAWLNRRWWTRGTALLVAGACAATGPVWYALRTEPPVTGSVRVAVVQPGVLDSPAAREAAEEAATAGLPPGADLVVWGESSVDADLSGDPALLARLQALSATAGADLLVNVDAPSVSSGGWYKQSVLISPNGEAGSYEKNRLVPFGEYIPLRPLLGWTADLSKAAQTNRLRGHGLVVLHTGSLSFAPLICFESAFPDMARDEVAKGAQLIVYQTSTSTFQGSWGQPQHASLAAVRAAETGRPVVQSGLTGVSAAFDAQGRQLAWYPPSFRGAFTVTMPLASGRTPYDRTGDWVLALAFTTLAGAVTATTLRPRSARPPGQGLS
ncbi:apolipoprotein N-acyltransferase [Kitasatospora sp. MAP12-15]|uniref:apolipoprotein N-acyltransferase n=1 Tax=unclassified Kitasatospora TaxID=2633591 RepID=UPI0024741DD6|nr:apolipoprotein N-acyltransferase [Kitasatospora sp. MAP12-44]MDH6113819.1 apolipoprotein N-acyltransferase [Kitasatospora sp. MAP12-44]